LECLFGYFCGLEREGGGGKGTSSLRQQESQPKRGARRRRKEGARQEGKNFKKREGRKERKEATQRAAHLRVVVAAADSLDEETFVVLHGEGHEVGTLLEGETVGVVDLEGGALAMAAVAARAAVEAGGLLGSHGDPGDRGLGVRGGDGELVDDHHAVVTEDVLLSARGIVRGVDRVRLAREAQLAARGPAGGLTDVTVASTALGVHNLVGLAESAAAREHAVTRVIADTRVANDGAAGTSDHAARGADARADVEAAAVDGLLGLKVRATGRAEADVGEVATAADPATALFEARGLLPGGVVLSAVRRHELVRALLAAAVEASGLVHLADKMALAHRLRLGDGDVHGNILLGHF